MPAVKLIQTFTASYASGDTVSVLVYQLTDTQAVTTLGQRWNFAVGPRKMETADGLPVRPLNAESKGKYITADGDELTSDDPNAP